MEDHYGLGMAEMLFDTGLSRGLMGRVRVIESPVLTKLEQYFFPRSKKKRIREKCPKKYVRRVPDMESWYLIGDRAHSMSSDIGSRNEKNNK